MRRKRIVASALVLVGLVLLVVVAFVLRATVFAPRFDVASIALAPSYKNDALLDRAWSLPVAATYDHRVVWQTNGSVCGPASLANAMRSLGDASATQDTVLAGTGQCRTGICFGGLTLDELAVIARAKTGKHVTVLRDLGIEELRTHLRRANDPSRRYLVNFHRGMLFGKGVGHHSPIAAYLEPEDLVLVLDVNEAFGPWLVSTERLFAAMDTIDPSSGKKRGLLLLE
ncbi:MAG TPA: phytochelatin synthase family protein [Labilithrix sp.]